MKKYLLKLTAFVLLVGAVVSCSEDKVFYDGANGPTLAQFVNTDGSFAIFAVPSKNVDSIKVQVSTISNVDRKITVSIDPIGSDPNIGDYIEIVSATSVIPAGEYTGNAIIKYKKTYDDITFDKDLTLVLKLDGVEGASVEKLKSLFQVDIFKTCDFDATKVGTSFTAEVVINALPGIIPETGAPSYEPVVTTPNAAKPNEIHLNSLWGPDFYSSLTQDPKDAGKFPMPGKMVVNVDNNSIKIVGDPVGTQPSYITGGTDTYDACKNIFKYTLTQSFFTTAPFTVTVTLTPN